LVSEDLHLFDCLYTADILGARGYGHARGSWAAAAWAARGPRSPGDGSTPPSSSVLTTAAGTSTAGPSPPSVSPASSPGNCRGSQIVEFDPVEQCDIPDAAFNQLDHVPSDRLPQGLARGVACDIWELRGYTTGTLMAGLCQNIVSPSEAISKWARDNPGVPPRQVEELLQLVGGRGVCAALLNGTGVAAGGEDRPQQPQRDHDGYKEEPPTQLPRGLPGHGWGGSASGQR